MRSPPLTDQQILQALSLLGLRPGEFQNIRLSSGPEEAQAKLDDLKTRAKKAYKQQVLKLHPDQNGGDQEKTDQFKLLTTFMSVLDDLKIRVRPPPPPPRPMPFVHPMWGGTQTATTTVIMGGFGVRVFIRTA